MRNPSTTRTAKSARTTRSLTLLGVLAILLAAAGGYAIAAPKAPSVPTPTITSGPSGATTATAATFTFTGARGDTFECSLDGSSFAACTSPKTYAGPLANGQHTFQVRERTTAGATGTAASRSWTVDTQAPPAPQITQAPADPSASTSATFTFADAEPNVTYLCQLDGGAFAACSTPQTYSRLADGVHALSFKARDAAGNVGPATAHRWRIDTIAPPKPVLLQKPANPSPSSSATFAFSDAESGATFECRIDGGAWAACTSPTTYARLSNGKHDFGVRARDAAGNRSAAAEHAWRVVPSTSGQPFTIGGGATGTLVPGRSLPLALRLTNPNGDAILVTSLTVTVQPGSTRAGCDGPANLLVTQSNVSAANPLEVPANGSVTLPAGAVSAPQVLMRNLSTNQDACKGATFSFGYVGSTS